MILVNSVEAKIRKDDRWPSFTSSSSLLTCKNYSVLMKTLSDVWWSVVWQVPSYFRRFRCHEIVGIGTRRDATKRREQKNGRRYYLQILCAPVARSLSLSLSRCHMFSYYCPHLTTYIGQLITFYVWSRHNNCSFKLWNVFVKVFENMISQLIALSMALSFRLFGINHWKVVMNC